MILLSIYFVIQNIETFTSISFVGVGDYDDHRRCLDDYQFFL
jgi:hypothetical protein